MKRYIPSIIVGVILTIMFLLVNARLDNDRSFNPPPAPVTTTIPSSSIGTALVCTKDANGVISCKETP